MAFWSRAPRPTGNPNALTASGQRVTKGDADTLRRLAQPWQARAFAYYDMLGEIKYASQFYSRALSNLDLFAAEIDEDGDVVATKDEKSIEALDRIQDPGGGRSGLLAAYGRLMFLTGEALLFVTHDEDTGAEQWEMLSTDELRVQDGSVYLRYKAPSLQAEEFHAPKDDDWKPVADKQAVAYRLWQRHPQYSMLADATMRGVLDLCEELVILTHAVRSRARSRLAGAGILFLSEAFSPPTPLEPSPDEDIEEDPFLSDLKNAMLTAISDEGSASAVVPLVIRGPTEAIEKGVRHLQVVDPTQLYPETGLRYECIKRIAIGLDMPPEILMGLQDSNHWSAWQIDEQTWKSHLQPKAQQLVDDLTSAYYRPTLKADGFADYRDYTIEYDASAIINHPDRTKDAKDLYKARVIGKKALREAGGFDEEDAPTEEERAEMIGVEVRDSSLAWYGIPSVRGGNIEPTAGDVEDATSGGDPGAPSTGAEVEAGPPPGEPEQPISVVGAAANGHGTARIAGAALMGLVRAREAAGNRLKSLAKRDPEALALLDGVRVGQVAHVLGADRARSLGAPSNLELCAGARELIVDALRMWDVHGELAARIADTVEQHAARTLYEEIAQLPDTFEGFVTGLTSAKR